MASPTSPVAGLRGPRHANEGHESFLRPSKGLSGDSEPTHLTHKAARRCVNTPGLGRHHAGGVDVKHHSETPGLCTYCGWDAESVDHLMPRTWTGEAARQFVTTVPACKDCNSRIGDQYAPTVAMRKSIAYESLERKHRKLLATRSWADDELEEFGTRLRHELEAREALRRIVKYRLDNLARDEGAPIGDWLEHAAAYGDKLAQLIIDRKRAGALAAKAA